jgi:DNA repair exonuclease SbcCD nuclease subunit
MKILHSADWHLDAPLHGQEVLKESLLTIPSRIIDLCKREQCDLVLLAGDLFDGPYTQKSYKLLYDALAEMAVPVFISPGNHDFISPESPYIKEKWPENVHIFRSNQIEKTALPGVTVWGAGYTSMDCPGLLSGFAAEETGLQIGILHGDISPRSNYCPITKKQVEQSGLDYLALGHIHKGDYFLAGNTLCAFPGCPMGKDFGEDGEKGVYIVDTDHLSAPRFVSLGLPAFFDLTATVEGLSALLPPVATGDYYRVTLTGHSEKPNLQGLKAEFAHIPNLTLRDSTLPPIDLWKDAGADSFAGAYFALLKEQASAPEPETAKIYTLAAQISRQILDGEEVVLP